MGTNNSRKKKADVKVPLVVYILVGIVAFCLGFVNAITKAYK